MNKRDCFSQSHVVFVTENVIEFNWICFALIMFFVVTHFRKLLYTS